MNEHQLKLSNVFHHIRDLGSRGPVTIQRIIEELGQQSHGFLIMFLCFPFMLPIPVPGLSTVFGVIIAFVALAWMLGVPPRVPRRVGQIVVPDKILNAFPRYAELIFSKVEKIVRPRASWSLDLAVLRLMAGLVIILSALVLALPLPPGTNFPPAIVIFLIALSIIERDGILLLTSLILFGVGAFAFSELTLMAVEKIRALIDSKLNK